MFKKYQSRRITIDTQGTSADSPDVQKRLERIRQNYLRLDEILVELETRIEFDDRLAEIMEHDQDPPAIRKPR